MTAVSARAPANQLRRAPIQALNLLARLVTNRLAFAITVAFAAGLIWVSPRPPMIDLPQHVAQITLWRDLILGQSAWADLFRINLLTPYLIGYGLALPLAFVMPALTAVKIILTLAFAAFVVSCVQLSREVGADKRLDWLFIPGFFGFAYDWGFYTFLVASPLAIQFVRFAWRHAETADRRAAAWIVGLGCALLFSHGLMFLFAGAVGGLLLLTHAKSVRDFAKATLPYAVLAVACGAFFVVTRSADEAALDAGINWYAYPLERFVGLLLHVQSAASDRHAFLTAALLAAPILLGVRLRRLAAVPLVLVVFIQMFVPATILATDHVSDRFALFTLVFFAMACAADPQAQASPVSKLAAAALVVACWSSIAIQAHRAVAFNRENVDFERVLAAAEPRKRALSIPFEPESPAADNPRLAIYQPSWYQVEKGGLVDFNFAYFPPQIVRFRAGLTPRTGFGFAPSQSLRPDSVIEHLHLFDYIFLREREDRPPPAFLGVQKCALTLVHASGPWSLYARGACKT